jgi:hypothetical protein
MKDRIQNGANLLKDHVFQFDFLNDSFDKLPKGLQDIINDSEKRRKLVVYINPPYAEAGSTVTGEAKTGVSNDTMIHKIYYEHLGKFAKRELFVQLIIRIYREISGSVLAEFSKLKILQAPYFKDFRENFRAKLERIFLVPADSFDNVNGSFPIGFMIWNTSQNELFESVIADVYNDNETKEGEKTILNYDNAKFLNDWLRPSWRETKERIAYMACNSNDFQHQNEVVIQSIKNNETSTFYKPVTQENFIKSCIYFTVRKIIKATWLNDRDQFLYPNEGWEMDTEFQNDCLTYALFNNNIQSKFGKNNWIPFTEYEVNARDKFESCFMTDFISGKLKQEIKADLFDGIAMVQAPLLVKREFSPEATAVFDAGRELWRYYHSKPDVNVNASFYDIREYFQERNDKGKMNNTSNDEKYTKLISEQRDKIKILSKKIAPKVFQYGFLKG